MELHFLTPQGSPLGLLLEAVLEGVLETLGSRSEGLPGPGNAFRWRGVPIFRPLQGPLKTFGKRPRAAPKGSPGASREGVGKGSLTSIFEGFHRLQKWPFRYRGVPIHASRRPFPSFQNAPKKLPKSFPNRVPRRVKNGVRIVLKSRFGGSIPGVKKVAPLSSEMRSGPFSRPPGDL